MVGAADRPQLSRSAKVGLDPATPMDEQNSRRTRLGPLVKPGMTGRENLCPNRVADRHEINSPVP